MQWRGTIIDIHEEAFRSGTIQGLQYHSRDCKLLTHQALHGKIYTPDEARRLSFGPDCRCDLIPYKGGARP